MPVAFVFVVKESLCMFFLPSPPSSISFPGSNASVLFCSLLICRCFVRGLTSGWSYSRLLFGVRQLWRQHLFIVVALDSFSNILDKGTMSRFNLTWRFPCDSSWSWGLFCHFVICTNSWSNHPYFVAHLGLLLSFVRLPC